VTAAQHFYLPSPPRPLPSLTPYTPTTVKPDTFGQLWTLYLLGPGAEGGQPGVAHGGCISALLDEQASALMRAWAAAGVEGMVYCNVRYHGSIRVPGVVLCKASKARVEGRKVWVEMTVEDGEGRVVVRGEVLFVNDERGGAKL
jgi:Thioesterase superfamily